jgi:tRNA threonylcarbamoyladenosine biosynthesis protein TsaB
MADRPADRPVILLAIESATDLVGVALVRDHGGEVERVHAGGRAHAELLAPAIEEVCALSGCTVGEVDTIAVDVGPGLFTGLRVGVATAKALAQALPAQLLGVSSLDILAAAALEQLRSDGDASDPASAGSDLPAVPVAAVVDARRGEVFAAVYRFDRARGAAGDPDIDPAGVRVDRPVPIGPTDLEAWLLELGEETGRVVVVGDGAVRYRPLLAVHPVLDLRLADQLAAPPPLTLARLARSRLGRGEAPVAAVDLVPDYRRPADARINWEQRAPRQVAAAGGGDRPGSDTPA